VEELGVLLPALRLVELQHQRHPRHNP
jgi:hypothetical protein